SNVGGIESRRPGPLRRSRKGLAPMAEVNRHEMNATVLGYVGRLVGQGCCRQHIGKDRSLNLGFGEVIRHKSAIAEADHGTWEIGTYYCSWRVIYNGKIVCASQDTVDDIEELRQKIREIEWGRFSA